MKHNIRIGDIVRTQGHSGRAPIREGVVQSPAEYAPDDIRILCDDGIVYAYEPRCILDRLENGYRRSVRLPLNLA